MEQWAVRSTTRTKNAGGFDFIGICYFVLEITILLKEGYGLEEQDQDYFSSLGEGIFSDDDLPRLSQQLSSVLSPSLAVPRATEFSVTVTPRAVCGSSSGRIRSIFEFGRVSTMIPNAHLIKSIVIRPPLFFFQPRRHHHQLADATTTTAPYVSCVTLPNDNTRINRTVESNIIVHRPKCPNPTSASGRTTRAWTNCLPRSPRCEASPSTSTTARGNKMSLILPYGNPLPSSPLLFNDEFISSVHGLTFCPPVRYLLLDDHTA